MAFDVKATEQADQCQIATQRTKPLLTSPAVVALGDFCALIAQGQDRRVKSKDANALCMPCSRQYRSLYLLQQKTKKRVQEICVQGPDHAKSGPQHFSC